jgi:hypothetical protein
LRRIAIADITPRQWSAALLCLVMGLCILVYADQPNSADGDAMLAAAASLVRTGDPTIGQVLYSDMLFPIDHARMGTIGNGDGLYSKKGVTPSLVLLPLVALADQFGWPTQAAAVMLNPLVTAFTALLILRLVMLLGYSAPVGFFTGLLYACCTIALHYSRTLFGEPLAALCMVAAVYGLVGYDRDFFSRRLNLWTAGIALGALVGVNTIYVIPCALLTCIGIGQCIRRRAPQEVAGLLVPLAAWALLLVGYNLLRFGDPFTSGYRFADGEGFTEPFFEGLAGLTISPYRGLLWYSPVVLLALPGALLLFRRTRWTWLMAGLIVLQAGLFATWWSWSGGVVWGTRFMLPVVPLALALSAPVIAWAGRSRIVLACTAFVALVSGVIAVSGALADEYAFIAYLTQFAFAGDVLNSATFGLDRVLFNGNYSGVAGAIAQLLAGQAPVAAWAQHAMLVPFLLMAAAMVAVGLAVLLVRPRDTFVFPVFAASFPLLLIATMTLMAQTPPAAQVQRAADALDTPGTLFAQTTGFGPRLIDVPMRASVVVVNAPTEPDDRDARPAWEWAVQQHDRLWLLTWFGPADTLNWAERDAWERFAFVREVSVENHRALLFDTRPIDSVPLASGFVFGTALLESLQAVRHDDGWAMALTWRAGGSQPEAGWFVHLLDAGGQIIAQQDRAPLGGYAPVQAWSEGDVFTDRLFLPVDPAQAAGVRIGWVDVVTGERLPVRDSAGAVFEDGFIVLPLTD